jgi:uncharacterized membrane protein SirB2
MSTNPNYRKYPSSLGPVAAVLLLLGGMALLIFGIWSLSVDITDGIVELLFSVSFFAVFAVLFFVKRRFLFPPSER